MAMKRAATSAIRALSSSSPSSSVSSGSSTRLLHASAESKKIVGVFYKANEYASLNPNFVGSLEGALGIRDWLESQGHQYIVTDDKEGLDSEQDIFKNGQLRYAAGVKDMLDRYFKGEEFPQQNYIVKEGKLASQYL